MITAALLRAALVSTVAARFRVTLPDGPNSAVEVPDHVPKDHTQQKY